MSIFIGKSDRVIIWGSGDCTECLAVKSRLQEYGHTPELKDMDAELALESAFFRREVMAAYSLQGYFPVVQVNDRACTVREAYDLLEMLP